MSKRNRFLLVVALLVAWWVLDFETEPEEAPPAGGPAAAAAGFAPTPPWPPEGAEESELASEVLTATYYVVLDGSGSMRDEGCSGGMRKIDAAKEALSAFVRSLPADVNLGLLAFDGQGVSERLPIQPVEAYAFDKQLQQIQPSSSTPLRSAVQLGYDALIRQGRRQLGYGEYHLVVVTDGQASSGQDPTLVVNEILADSPVVIHTIGFCIGDDHSLNQRGRVLYRTAQTAAELREGLEQVLAEAPDFTVTQF